VEACLIGVISAVAALTLKQGIGLLGTARVEAANEFGWFILPMAGLLFGGLTGMLLKWVAPEAQGSGITQIKLVLAQLGGSLSLRAAVVKLLGTILILGAGFTLGRRGPTVHIGAALAAQLSMWLPSSPQHRRQMIAAGAASGLAAGFNTPIAGIVFVVEELMRDISGFTLEAAILASFTGAVVSRLFEATFESNEVRLPDIVEGWEIAFNPEEIPFFFVLGIAAGLLGVLFNNSILFSINFYNKLNWSLPVRIAIAGFLSGSIVATLPEFFRNNAGLRDFLITGEADWQITALILVAYFCLTIIAAGSGAPGGLFSPGLVLGAALGYLIGVAQVSVAQVSMMEVGSETTYALAGMGAVFTAIVRVPVTAIVIIFELTASFELVLPLMLTCAIAYLVGENLSKGSLYQKLLVNQGIPFQEESQVNPVFTNKTAEQVMTFPVESLSPDLTLEETCQAVFDSPHRAFPVTKQSKLVGMITQKDLSQFIGSSQSLLLENMMTKNPISVSPNASLQSVLNLLNRYELSHIPVTKRQRLVGMISHSDVIRAEAEEFNQGSSLSPSINPQLSREPSYVVYQTRSPSVGKGRILLPIANPNTAVNLTEIASAIAYSRQAELEILYLIQVPRNESPNQVWVNPTPGRRLLQQAEAIAIEQDIPVHTQLRTTNYRSHTILELIQQRRISLLVMGWQGKRDLITGRLFSTMTETMIQKASCDVVLIKSGNVWSNPQSLSGSQRWLIPVPVGDSKADKVFQLLPQLNALIEASSYIVCPIYSNPDAWQQSDISLREYPGKQFQKQLHGSLEVIPVVEQQETNTILQLAQQHNCDVILLMTTHFSPDFTQQPNFNNGPLATIVNRFQGTLILFRPN